MGLYEFNILNKDDKARILWNSGVFLMNRFENGYSINLYSLFDFYVEVWYLSQTNEIERLHTFKSLEKLQPFIERINLDLG